MVSRMNRFNWSKQFRRHNHATPTIGSSILGPSMIIYLIIAQLMSNSHLFVGSSPMGHPDDSTTRAQAPERSENYAKNYLQTYGYLDGSEADSLGEDALSEAVIKFQKLNGLSVTGEIDDEMLKFMRRGRCGNRDFDANEYIDGRRGDKEVRLSRRSKRFALNGSSWPKTSLTYYISNYPPSMSKKDVRRTIATAFNLWSQVANLNFSQVSGGMADIYVKFHKLNEGCKKGAFKPDVRGHAFFPTPSAPFTAIHFNNDIEWTAETKSKDASLLATAIHEIGHALGVSHSPLHQAKMYAYENGLVSLTDDDIKAIQALYMSRDDNGKIGKYFTISDKVFARKRSKREQGPVIVGGDERILYKKRANFLDDCKNYLANNNYLVGLWNRTEKQCYIKRTYENPEVTFYTGRGKAVGHHDLYADVEDFSNSTAGQDLEQMILVDRNCDRILKLDNWPQPNETTYKCKKYADDSCCTMIFRLGMEENIPDAIKVTIQQEDYHTI